jgi:hypothetical protein
MSVTIQLIGGLGNQLFGYFAGRHISRILDANLVLNLEKQRFNAHDRSSILDLQFVTEATSWSTNGSVVEKLVNAVPSRLFDAQKFSRRFLGYYRSADIGFDSTLDLVKDGTLVSGYFQTHRYFDAEGGSASIGQLAPVRPSTWFSVMQEKARELNPIMVHVRRGDYLESINQSIGALARGYFEESLEKVRSDADNSDREIWLFSDSAPEVQAELSGLSENLRVIFPPTESKAVESMALFSLGSAHIISNSTFSYWGAMFSKNSRVIAPTKWFRGMEDPRDLIPPTWTRVTSKWM